MILKIGLFLIGLCLIGLTLENKSILFLFAAFLYFAIAKII